MDPVVGTLETALASDLPVRAVAERAVELFVREIYGTRRKEIIRLIISEGPRFPALADFYYREVLARIIAAVRGAARPRARARRDRRRQLIRFPQLLGAARIVAIVWRACSTAMIRSTCRAMLRAHLDRLFAREGRPT